MVLKVLFFSTPYLVILNHPVEDVADATFVPVAFPESVMAIVLLVL